MPNYQATHRIPAYVTVTVRAENEDEARDRIWDGEWDCIEYQPHITVDHKCSQFWALHRLKKVDEPDQAEVSDA